MRWRPPAQSAEMSRGVKTKRKPAQAASAPARALARAPDQLKRATAKGAAKHRRPIGAPAVATALSLRANPSLADEGKPTALTSAAPAQRTSELVFVDSTTPRYQSLIEDMRTAGPEGRRLEFVLIDPWRDGVHKITETLIQKKGLDAIHIVSHARDGAVRLGSAQLDFDTVLRRAGQITAWCDALNANGDILLYGCDLAASQEGKALLEALSRLTGADAAGVTGSAAQGGDWKLEFKPGAIEVPIVVKRDEMRDEDKDKKHDEHRAACEPEGQEARA